MLFFIAAFLTTFSATVFAQNNTTSSAGVVISNQASVSYKDPDGKDYTVVTSTVTFTVRPISGVTVTPDETAASSNHGPREQFTRLFRVCNTGNFPDVFTFTRADITSPVTLNSLHFDVDASGTVTSGDTLITLNTTQSPRLAPGECVGVIASVDTKDAQPRTTVNINVTAKSVENATANGPSTDDGTIILAIAQGASFSSPQSIELPPIKLVENKDRIVTSIGQTLNYLISFKNRGAVPARNVLISDDLPSQLEYIAGSLKLGTRAVTDADDRDPGLVTGQRIEVRVAEVAPAEVVEIRFQARLTVDVLPGMGIINTATVSGDNVAESVRTTEATAVINPLGIIYAGHSSGTVRISGARVVVSTDQAGDSPLPLTPNSGSSPNQQNSNPFVTDSQGQFSFALASAQAGNGNVPVTYFVNVAAPGYRARVLELTVTPVGSGLFTATVRALDGQPVARAGAFSLTTDPVRLENLAALVLNIPVFEAAALEIAKVADRSSVQIGDALSYRIEARNATSSPVSETTITDTLPDSFYYVPGTARIEGTSIISRPLEPEVQGNKLIFRIGEIVGGARIQLSYRVRIGVNAREGEQLNSATISGRFPSGETLTTRPARASVFVGRGILSMRQIVIGRVFEDANANGQFDKGERPIAGVRLYVSNGQSVMTDSEGLYNLPSVSEGSIVISLDPITVPQNYRLLDEGLRASFSWTRLLRTPLGGGSLLKQDFALLPPADIATKLKQASGAFQESKAMPAMPCRPNGDCITFVQANGSEPLNSKANSADKPVNSDTNKSAVHISKALRDGVSSETFTEEIKETIEPVAAGTVRVLSPQTETVMMSAAMRLAASVAAGWSVNLEVGGQKVSDSLIGEKREDNKNKITTFIFVGVNLRPGPNAVKVIPVSPKGEKGQAIDLTVYGRGPAKRLEIAPERTEMTAGGRDSMRVVVRAYDQWNHPAADSQIAIETSSGRLLPQGCKATDSPTACQQISRLKQNVEDKSAIKLRPFGDGTDETAGLTSEQVNENVRQQIISLENGEAVTQLISEGTAGEAVLRADSGDLQAWSEITFTPELRKAIMAGLAEVSIGRAAPENALFNRNENYTSRLNFFYRGSFLHRNLLTVAYDSARPLQRSAGRDRLFQLDPLDRLYPLFGDSSTRYDEAQSNSKLYARIDRGRSYALFGDFSGGREESFSAVGTAFTASSSFANNGELDNSSGASFGRMLTVYSRNLTGVKVHLANEGGDFLTLTGARPDTAFARDVFPGASFGLLRLSRGEVMQGSETLVLEVRDRRNPDIVLSREPLVRSVDYNLDPLTGAVFFLRPISAFDHSFNLLQVVATYEYRVSGLSSAVYTARASKQFSNAGLRVGASFVNQRQADFGPYYVGGVDGEKSLPHGGKLFFEWGMTDGRVAAAGNYLGGVGGGFGIVGDLNGNSSNAHNGHAYRVEFYQPITIKEGALRASFTKAGAGFFNPFGGTIAPGSQRSSAAISLKVRPTTMVSLGFTDERNKTANVNNQRSTASVGLTESIGERVKVSAGYDFRDFNDSAGANNIQSNLVTVGAEWKATDKLNIAAKREQNLTASDPTYPNQTTVNATYQFNEIAKLFFSQRLASAPITPISDVASTGFASLGSRQETAIGVETRVGRYTSLNSNYRIENSINGTDSFAVMGLTNRLPLNKKLSLDFGFERGFHIDGEGQSFNSANVGFAWQPTENFRSSARYELRDRLGFGQIVTLGAAGKLNDSVSALGRFQMARANFAGRSNEAMNATAALSVRPLQSDRTALLFSYTRRSYAQAGLTNSGDVKDRDDVLSSDGLVKLKKELEFYGKFALRIAGNGQPQAPYISTLTYLAQSRLQYRFAKYFDAAGEARLLGQPVTGTSRTGLGAEIGFWALSDLRLGVGYNFTKADEQANRSAFGLSKRGVYFVISSKLSNVFNLFGTSREGLVAMDDVQTHEYLAQNFDPRKAQTKNDAHSSAKPAVNTAKPQAVAKLPDNQSPVPQQALKTMIVEQPAAPVRTAKSLEPILSESVEPTLQTPAEPVPPPVAVINATNAAPINNQPGLNKQVSEIVYTVQIGSHQRLADARKHAAYLNQFGIATRIVRAGIPGRGIWYRVQSGQFSTLDDAGNYGEQMKAQGALVNFVIADFQTTDPIN